MVRLVFFEASLFGPASDVLKQLVAKQQNTDHIFASPPATTDEENAPPPGLSVGQNNTISTMVDDIHVFTASPCNNSRSNASPENTPGYQKEQLAEQVQQCGAGDIF